MVGTISFSRYVSIRSSVIGAGGTRARDLILRLISSNPLISPDEVLEFDTPTAVGDFFGYESQEYRRAQFGFSWVSPRTTVMKKISFARSMPSASAPAVFGISPADIPTFSAIGSAGRLDMVAQGTPVTFQGIDMTTVLSYAAVADAVQTVMRASSNPVFATATISYDGTRGAFIFTGSDGSVGTIEVTGGNLAVPMGWLGTGVRYVSGAAARSIVETVQLADSLTDNYFSLRVMDTLTLAQHLDVARALNAIGDNKYMYLVAVTAAVAETWVAAMLSIPGIAVGLSSGAINDFGEMIPGIQTASINYSAENATMSFMYREFDAGYAPVTVSDDTTANTMDALRVNYIGQTQKAGIKFAFYQRAVLMGPVTSALDQNVYANEAWLKDYAATNFMDLLRALPELPADESGRTYGMSTLQGIVDQGLRNGVVSPGRTLNATQRAAVTAQSGDSNAWRQVEVNGYWMDVTVTEETAASGITEYTLDYLLIYAKKNTIRKVNGRHQLV